MDQLNSLYYQNPAANGWDIAKNIIANHNTPRRLAR